MNDSTDSHMDATPRAPLRHSGVGIASFVLGIFTLLLFCVLLIIATGMAVAHGGQLDARSMQAILIGLVLLLGGLIALVGVGLGIGCMYQRNRSKILGGIGLCLNGLVAVAVAACFIIGNMKT